MKRKNQYLGLSRKMSELLEEARQRMVELRLAQMRHQVHVAEIKKNALVGSELCGALGFARNGSEAKPCGLPIQ